MTKVSRLMLSIVFASIPVHAVAQFAEQNVNMVSGQSWPGGDPFLRQQNEPSLAISTRNPLHLLAGANDYRTVDIAFSAPARPDSEETGDAWLGWFKSKDGGNKWFSGLIDGYPQQANLNSPLTGFQAAADPVVRAGNNGMFYYAGIVLNRGTNPASGVFVARFIDNNIEVADPIAYIDTKLIDHGSSGQFIDKPWMAVSPITNGTQCTVNGQTFLGQNIYVAYSVLVGNDNNVRTKIMFTKSSDCGATWGSTQKLSETYSINQGVNIAVDPNNPNNVYVAWRRFAGGNDPNSIIIAKSTNAGGSFSKGVVVTNVNPFDQGTTTTSIRTNAYPALAVDISGRVHVAWSQRQIATNDGRIVLTSSADGQTNWSAPAEVSPVIGGTSGGRGHQFMPTMLFAAGKLTLAWYDLRDDQTIAGYALPYANGQYTESRLLAGNLFIGQPQVVFWDFLADQSPFADLAHKLLRRHTLEVYATESTQLGAPPAFAAARRVTRYVFGSVPPAYSPMQDLQINPPNLPMFRGGTLPFFGDYIDVAAYLLQGGNARVRHVVWTDDRDVRAPLGAPPDWTKYTPVSSAALGQKSLFDPTQVPPPCIVDASGTSQSAGSRNQNIYTTRVTDGLFAGSPTNFKPLGTIQRAFAVFVQNTTDSLTAYTLVAVPTAGTASFSQSDPTKTQITINVAGHSTATRTVFVNAPAGTKVNVSITGGGLTTVVTLNGDATNPQTGFTNTDIFNPDIGNPDIGNPDIGNPDIGNPDIGNPDIGNPDIGNPDIGNPDIGNPDIGNPDIGNPDIGNPDIGNGSVTDTTWTTTNQGDTTGGYTVKVASNAPLPGTISASQLIVSKVYDTPAADGCQLSVYHNKQIVSAVNNPTFIDPAHVADPVDPSADNSTLWLAPGETGKITVRLIDRVNKGLTLDASSFVFPVVIAQSANTGETQPRTAIAFSITTTALPDGVVNVGYTFPPAPGCIEGCLLAPVTLEAAGGIGARTWSALKGLPAGLSVDPATGIISGTPTTAGDSFATFSVHDAANPPHVATRTILMHITAPLQITTLSANDAVTNQLYSTQIDATGGTPPYTWSVSGQPAGFAISSTGLVTNTFTTAGSGAFSVAVSDSGNPAQRAFGRFGVTIADPLTINTTTLPTATQGFSYSTPLASTGGIAPIHWTIDTGSFGDGMSLSDAGTVSGLSIFTETPVAIARATDSSHPAQTTTQQLILVIQSAVCGGNAFSLSNFNANPVAGGGTNATFNTDGVTMCLVSVETDHSNGGAGATPGTIGIRYLSSFFLALGPWPATGTTLWTASPPQGSQVVLNGTFTIVDSDPATWSQNAQTQGQGFWRINVVPASIP